MIKTMLMYNLKEKAKKNNIINLLKKIYYISQKLINNINNNQQDKFLVKIFKIMKLKQ